MRHSKNHSLKTGVKMAPLHLGSLDRKNSTVRGLFVDTAATHIAPPHTSSINPSNMPSAGGLRLKGFVKQSNAKLPLISIITVVYNGVSELASTIDSVLRLAYDNIEYIIIDGDSKDGTRELIQRYDCAIDYWVSEADRGIYDAMNKGIELATGDFVYHLNIGDKIMEIPTDSLVQLPASSVCLACSVRLTNGQVFNSAGGIGLRSHNTIHHQGCFYRRGSQVRYSTEYRVFSDFDLNQRLMKRGWGMVISSLIVAEHDPGGASHQRSQFGEVFRIVNANYGPLWVVVSYLYFKLSGLRRRIARS